MRNKSPNVAIKVENLSKKYIIRHEKQTENYETFSDTLIQGSKNIANRIIHPFSGSNTNQQTQEEFWALKDINFEINQGDKVGIIGRNGAGKSTLLKILSRITEPTSGKIHINGRIASLLEVGTGFHPELTGRENIFLNGAILGMSRREIKAKFDKIIDFAEVEKFLDTPVKRYSSGMYVRLAFAIAAHLEPEILVVDEVLAVGDVEFQKKCLGKMEAIGNEGRTVLFVSHNMAAVRALCSSAILLENGTVKIHASTETVVSNYLNFANYDNKPYIQFNEKKELPIQLLSISIIDNKDVLINQHQFDEEYFLKVNIVVRKDIENIYIATHISDPSLETIIFSRDFESDEKKLEKRYSGSYTYLVKIPTPLLVPGLYNVSIHIVQTKPIKIIERADHVCSFELIDKKSIQAKIGFPFRTKIYTPLKWEKIITIE